MNARPALFRGDWDYHLIRAAMVITFFFFGYQKWFPYEAETLIPYISNGPLVFWMYPVFGIRDAARVVGGVEWLFGALIFLGFWNKSLGARGAFGACIGAIATLTMLTRIPNAWDASAGGFPAMTMIGAFLMKDVVLLAASFYLLKQDVVRGTRSNTAEAFPEAWHVVSARRRARDTADHGSGTAA
jgi:uncharacterized membrane protein YkgB